MVISFSRYAPYIQLHNVIMALALIIINRGVCIRKANTDFCDFCVRTNVTSASSQFELSFSFAICSEAALSPGIDPFL